MLLFSKSFKPISFKFSDTSFKGRFIGLFFSQKTGYEVPLQVEPSAAAAESFFLAFFQKVRSSKVRLHLSSVNVTWFVRYHKNCQKE